MNKIRTRNFIRKHIDSRGEEMMHDIEPSMVLYWWRHLNIAVFDGMLLKPYDIHCRNFRDKTLGWVRGYIGYRDIRLGIRRQVQDRRKFLTILAHEMVHQYQWEKYKLANHNQTFFAWRESLKERVGLPLNYRI